MVLQVRVGWSGLGVLDSVSVLNFLDSAASAQACVDAVEAGFSIFMAEISNDYTMLIEPVVRDINTATGQLQGLEGVTTSAIVGGNAAAPLAQATQALIQWRTGTFVNGREVRGRSFIPGSTATWISDGEPDAGALTLLAAGGEEVITESGGTMAVWSRSSGTAHAVTSVSAWPEFAVLRSRRT